MPLTPEERRARNRIATRKYHRKNRDKMNERQRRRYREKPWLYVGARTRRLEVIAGRPKPDHCEICGGNKGGIDFDHCHQRGIFRGWICGECNSALGHVEDDPNRLRMLIAYLERTKDLVPPQLTLPV